MHETSKYFSPWTKSMESSTLNARRPPGRMPLPHLSVRQRPRDWISQATRTPSSGADRGGSPRHSLLDGSGDWMPWMTRRLLVKGRGGVAIASAESLSAAESEPA